MTEKEKIGILNKRKSKNNNEVSDLSYIFDG
jgi:hypothetical protein